MEEISSLTFEAAMERLKKLLEKMESAQLALDEAVAAYEESTALKKHCEAKLKQAQLRVEKIMNNDAAQSESFDEKE